MTRSFMRVATLVFAFANISWNAAHAQTALPADKLTWQQDAPSLADAQGYQYRLHIDGGAPVALVATCSGVAPSTCVAPLPSMTPGQHRLELAAVLVVDGAPLEGARSAALDLLMVAVPATPTNLRLTR